MSSETKRQHDGAKVPVALPRTDSDSSPAMLPREAVYKAVIGARIRITTAAPSSANYEGVVFTADPLSNFLVLCTSPSSAPSPTTPVPPGSYHLISISTINSFQLLSLPQPPPDPQSLILDPSTIDPAPLQQRQRTTIAKLAQAESRRGPTGTSPQAQDLFDALSRQYRMQWVPDTAAMILAEDYIIESPYTVADVKWLSSHGGGNATSGLERMKKVVQMERAKLELKWSAREIDGKMGKENKSTGASPRKGG